MSAVIETPKLNLIRPDVVPFGPAEPPRGMFNIPGCTITPTGMIIEPGLKIEQWIEAGIALRRAGDAYQLCVGDWILFGKKTYKRGEMYKQALEMTGFKEQTLKNNVWVAKAVPLPLRLEKSPRGDFLKFKHYKHIAPLESLREKKEWINKALLGNGRNIWSAKKLEDEINAIKQETEAPFSVELQRLHDKVRREDIDGAILDLRKRIEVVPDPLLATVYRRLIEILEWQKSRTPETDVAAIVKIFAAEEGTEAPLRVTDAYIEVWLRRNGFIMASSELLARLKLMVRIKMLTVEERTESKGDDQRGTVTHVYATTIDFGHALDRIDELKSMAGRTAALHKDWSERIARHAPELLPQKETIGESETVKIGP